MGKVLITGASGLIGRALIPRLSARGYSVVRLLRSGAQVRDGGGDLWWNPETGELDPASLEGFEAAVHLAGETISSRWTAARKRRIRESRVAGTRLLAERLALAGNPPKVFVSGSAIGFYGDRGGEVLTENSSSGTGFLAEVCRDWESATRPAENAGIRVVHIRTGLVLSGRGGALAKMLPAFRLGVGGKLGSGGQFMSWIGIDDLVSVFLHAIGDSRLRGAVNAVAPNPIANAEFTRTLGRVLRRPAVFPVPAFAIRALFGEMGEELLLSSSRVLPAKLTESGFEFQHPTLDGALGHLLHGSTQ